MTASASEEENSSLYTLTPPPPFTRSFNSYCRYYVWKVLAIVYLLIVSMFVIFVMDPVEDFADRINICLTLILAAVAFLYVVGEQLPKVPYLTLLDKLLLISFFFIFLGGVETLVAFLVKTHVDGDGDNGKMDGGNLHENRQVIIFLHERDATQT